MASCSVTTLCDAASHHFESTGALTRCRASAFADRGVGIEEIDGALRSAVEGEVLRPERRVVHEHAHP